MSNLPADRPRCGEDRASHSTGRRRSDNQESVGAGEHQAEGLDDPPIGFAVATYFEKSRLKAV